MVFRRRNRGGQMSGGFSAWMLHTYRRIRFTLIVMFVLGIILWYFNSILFYDVVDGIINGATFTGHMVVDFVGGF